MNYNIMKNGYVICINNTQNSASLIVGKVYRTIPEPDVEQHKMLRVIDEDLSEPDGYLYPASYFVPIEVPDEAVKALSLVGSV